MPYSKGLALGDGVCLGVDNYLWKSNDYKPPVNVFLCHDNEKLSVKFVAFEKEICCLEKNDNGRVWCDSCVEFFLKPFSHDNRYINFEINPIGAMIMSIGEGRNGRETLVFEYKKQLHVKTQIENEFWTVEFAIDFLMLKKIFQMEADEPLQEIYGNFYKCGDETKYPHYGMWNVIDKSEPDFHLPEYFGKLILE